MHPDQVARDNTQMIFGFVESFANGGSKIKVRIMNFALK